MNRYVAPLAISAGLLAGACASDRPNNDKLEAAEAGFELYVEQFGCLNPDEIVIKTADLSKEPILNINPGSVALGAASEIGIVMEQSAEPFKIKNAAIHEAFHACTDLTEIKYLPDRYEVEAGLFVTGARGFRFSFNESTVEKPDEFTIIEEGFAEWVSEDIADYVPSQDQSYSAVRRITEEVANISGLSRQEAVKLHEDDDIIGLVARLKNVKTTDVNGAMIADIIFLYQDAFTSGHVPPEAEVKTYLSLSFPS